MTPRRIETFAAVTAVAALVAGSVLAVSSAAAAPTVIDHTDFTDGTTGSWSVNGAEDGVELEVVSLGNVARISDRADDWDGLGATVELVEGAEYTYSMKVRLAGDVDDTTTARFVVGDSYSWVGNTSGVGAEDWTTVTGTYTAASTAPTSMFIGTDDISGLATYDYLVDDVQITGPGGAVLLADFEDETLGGLVNNGSSTSAVVADNVLQVAKRSADWHGITLSPTLSAGVEYDFSARVRLADGVPGTVAARFVVGTGYSWVGNTDGVSDDAWTTIHGIYTPTADGAAPVFLGTADHSDLTQYDYLVDDIRITAADDTGTPPPAVTVLSTDFEDGLDGWGPRQAEDGDTVAVAITTDPVHDGVQAAEVSLRTSQGSGIGRDVTGVLETGVTYEFTAWVRFAADQPAAPVWLSMAREVGGETTYSTLGQFDGVTSSGWTEVRSTFTMGNADSASIYLETDYNGTNTSTFYVDDIVVRTPEPAVIQDLTPLKDTVPFPFGVAIDSRETVGAPAELTLKHFNQISAENYMKPEAWYDANGNWAPSAEIDALMDFAVANDLDVYGHVLVWHSQTPAFFFQDASGNPLTTSADDQAILEQRLREHIRNVGQYLADGWGLFGGDNPLTAWDVVNEVVSDSGENADGLRRSEWYRILGERFIDLSFEYAEEVFNDEFAAPATDRPVTLFINDYNTEQSGKQDRYFALIERMLDRGAPLDGVGHQFHVSLAMPVSALESAITRFQGLGLTQAVTELDVTTGTPVTQAKLVDQGYYYRDAFRVFRTHAADLFSVTVWGLNDSRSWRSGNGAPLVFDDGLQAKPAYYGIIDDELPAPLRTANVFQADIPAVSGATGAPEWDRLPLIPISSTAEFQLRWSPERLTVLVDVDDATAGSDNVEFQLGESTVTLARDGSGDATGVVTERAGGYRMVVELPLSGAAEGQTLDFDVRVHDGLTTQGWNAAGVTGTLTLLEAVSFVEVVKAPGAPEIDGVVDAMWDDANAVTTAKKVEGDGAEATVRTLWRDGFLYVLAEVADPDVDVSGSDPWVQDSLELYVDPGNVKNGSYRYDDSQIRISAANVVSFGTGDEAWQRARVQSATQTVDGGYVVEVAVQLNDAAALGAFQGLDFQINDASGGARIGISNWADPSGAGYQSTARWGVGQLVGGAGEDPAVPTIELSAGTVRAGGTVEVELSGFEPGAVIDLVLDRPTASASGAGAGAVVGASRIALAVALPATLGSLTVGLDGSAAGAIRIPADTIPGSYRLAAQSEGATLASTQLSVLAAVGGPGAGLSSTGAEIDATVLLAALLLLGGATVMILRATARRRLSAAAND